MSRPGGLKGVAGCSTARENVPRGTFVTIATIDWGSCGEFGFVVIGLFAELVQGDKLHPACLRHPKGGQGSAADGPGEQEPEESKFSRLSSKSE